MASRACWWPGGSGRISSSATEPELAGIPVVAVTSFAMVGDRSRALAAGFDGYVAKPIDPETFVSELEAFCAPGRA
jgi:two-component system cell cycle response regulator